MLEEKTGPVKYVGLRVAGIASLGGVYLINVAVAALVAVSLGSVPVFPPRPSPLNALFIPIAGPWIALGNPSNQLPAGATLLVFDGLSQLASATMVVMAIVLHQGDLPKSAWRLSPGPGGITFSAQLP